MGEITPLEFVKKFGVLILVGVVGSGILIYGLWGVMGGNPPFGEAGEAKVEIISGNKSSDHSLSQGSELIIDVAGSVERPGVYKLPSGSRIGDALVAAGGLSSFADREWVAKTINLASEVKDGEKIYIPTKTERETPSQSQGEGVTLGSTQNTKLININTASASELDSLVGIGEVRAQAIIAGRPYGSTEELVSKAKIPQAVYDKIKDQVSVY